MTSPVIAGAAQVANHDDDRIVHPVALLAEAARAALADAGAGPEQVDGVLATPLSVFSSDSAAEMVAAELGLAPGRRVVSTYSGAAPQRLVQQACAAVADGGARAVLIVGGIADASVKRARRRGIEPPAPPTSVWSQGSGEPDRARVDRSGVDRPGWLDDCAELASGAGMPPAFFALIESSLHAGVEAEVHRKLLGELLAPFSAVAARRAEVAWFPVERTPDEIATVGPANRLVAEPYTKLMCSFPTVDQAAAVVVARADLVGRGAGAVVHPVAVTSAKDGLVPTARPVIHRSLALDRAVERALTAAELDPDRIDVFDLYSCFPAAVQLISAALGLADADPRPRTVIGGLPFFGGPGAAYGLHGLVGMVEELRARPGAVGAVVGLGGLANDFSVGVYGTEPRPLVVEDLGQPTDRRVPLATEASGPAVVEAMTVLHERDRGPVAAPVVARLGDGSRVGARAVSADLAAELSGTPLVGREVHLATREGRITYTV